MPFTGDDDHQQPARAGTVRLFSVGFVALLLLAIAWPRPALWINDLFVGAELAVDERSFLGREAPSWDALFWSIAGMYVLALLHGRLTHASGGLRYFVEDLRQTPSAVLGIIRGLDAARLVVLLFGSVVVISAVWMFLDGPLVELAQAARNDLSRATIRLLNRLGGGMNPVMIVGFFLIAGIALRIRRWWLLALAMAWGGVAAGLLVQIVKFSVDRSRPELWLGPFHFSDSPSSSFPSGHTIGAFALAAAVVVGSRSWALRASAFILAVSIGISRVIAFRHWPSDVVASAVMGSFFGWLFASAFSQMVSQRMQPSTSHAASLIETEAGFASTGSYPSRSANETDTSREQPASSIVTP